MVERYQIRTGADPRAATIDQGLRRYMLQVYNYMMSGVLLTGIMALLVERMPALQAMLYTVNEAGQATGFSTLGMIVQFAPLAFVVVLSFGIHKLSAQAAQTVFWIYAAVMGLSLSFIFMTYTGESIARTFFISAAAFGGLSLWGYTTKKNLSAMGAFLLMGLFGLIIASIVQIFLQSAMMDFIISIVGLLIFAGLTAYDTQRIRNNYAYMQGSEMLQKGAIMGALSLYLDFINMFLFLLRFFGNRE